jgi:hypothetical protein
MYIHIGLENLEDGIDNQLLKKNWYESIIYMSVDTKIVLGGCMLTFILKVIICIFIYIYIYIYIHIHIYIYIHIHI